ncbi:anti-sigma factor family protein [Streptomyces sp. 4F14]|uniref:anti-sigma factor family protein n=1 Tax=Streptomyces sp. 4F14 TaxID=3394380 RepID=UPI003A8B134F
MTSTTDTAGHPDVAELSDLTEGLLPPSRSAELHRHLDTCEPCTDTHASLEELRDLLGTFPEPVSMPDDVVLRIDAALAAEAGASETAVPDVTVETGEPDAEVTAEVAGVSRETSAPDRAPSRPSGRARTATTGPGRKSKDRPRSRRRTAAVLGVFTAAALGLGSVLFSSLVGGDGDSGGPTAADTFAKGTFQESVNTALKSSRSSRAPRGEVGIQGNVESPQVLSTPNVPPCVLKGTDRTDPALASKEGVYEGKDVLLVVFRNASDSSHVDAYLVDRACEQHPSTQADVLLKGSYAHP